jgi:hypothetical protein
LLALLAQAFRIIAVDGRDLPLAEDWLMIPALTGQERDVGRWLIEQWNEHIIPVPKLVYWGVLELGGGDFRTGMVFNALVLAALAAASIHAASQRRGGLRATDAFFPLVFLNVGEAANYAWGWQIQYVAAVLFTCLPLLVLVRHGACPPPAAAAVAAVSIACLPFTGANGLIFALALVPWYALVLWRQRAEPRLEGARTRTALLGAGAAGGRGVHRGLRDALLPSLVESAEPGPHPDGRHRAEVRGHGGRAGCAGTPRLVAAVLTPVLLGAAVLVVVQGRRALAARDDERWRVAGLVCFFGGCAVLTAAMGYGRAAWVPEFGIPQRYALLAAPTIVGAYLVWDVYGTPRLGAAARWALLALGLWLLPVNHKYGRYFVDWNRPGMDRALADVAAGVPRLELARRHREHLLRWDEAGLAARIGMLRDAGIGPFARVPPDSAPR